MKENWRTTYYRPMMGKSFEAALTQFTTREFPFLRGTTVVGPFVEEVKKLIEAYYRPASYLRPGQMIWLAVDKNEKLGYKKSITEIKTKAVVLTILHQGDISKYLKGVPIDDIRRDTWIRLFQEASKQGGVLSEIDVATIFRVDPSLVSRYIRNHEKERGTMVPRRGTIHDLGRSVTHKGTICKKKLTENKSTSQIAQETHHTPEAVDRYLKGLSQVVFCTERGMNIKDTSFVTSMSNGLVKQYVKLAKSLKPDDRDSVKQGPHEEET